ncbi:hypothetical protein GCM10023063_19050 [Arthrobacter methylotrophus]
MGITVMPGMCAAVAKQRSPKSVLLDGNFSRRLFRAFIVEWEDSDMDTLKAGPYDSEPIREIREVAARYGGDSVAAARARWREALEDVSLGEYDKRIVDWAERMMDQSTLWVFAGLIDRARQTGQQEAL